MMEKKKRAAPKYALFCEPIQNSWTSKKSLDFHHNNEATLAILYFTWLQVPHLFCSYRSANSLAIDTVNVLNKWCDVKRPRFHRSQDLQFTESLLSDTYS